jgi:hypothetical protein
LRIKGNSVRLRLTQGEVALAAKGNLIENRTDFGTQALRFGLVGRENASGLSASLEQNVILITAPKASLSTWAESDQVGLYGEQTTSTGQSLAIAVEKDFRCLDRSRAQEDEPDAYPHPKIKSGKA